MKLNSFLLFVITTSPLLILSSCVDLPQTPARSTARPSEPAPSSMPLTTTTAPLSPLDQIRADAQDALERSKDQYFEAYSLAKGIRPKLKITKLEAGNSLIEQINAAMKDLRSEQSEIEKLIEQIQSTTEISEATKLMQAVSQHETNLNKYFDTVKNKSAEGQSLIDNIRKKKAEAKKKEEEAKKKEEESLTQANETFSSLPEIEIEVKLGQGADGNTKRCIESFAGPGEIWPI